MNQHRRRGSIYITVLGASMLVTVIGITALVAARVQGWSASNAGDSAKARLYARSAIEVGMLYIQNDPNWRARGNGTWVNNQPMGDGTFSISATDPIDNDVTNGQNHPVILTGTGRKGQALYKLQARLEAQATSNSCLAVSMCSGHDTAINSVTLTSDQTITANGNMTAGSSAVNANVEAHNINGSNYTKATRIISTGRYMPKRDHVLDYYIANGTTIPYSSLPVWGQTQLLTNTGFETDIIGWYVYSLSITTKLTWDKTQHKDGSRSLKVASRKTADDVAAQDILPTSLQNGDTYFIDLPIRPGSAVTAQATLVLQSTGDGTQSFSTPAVSAAANAWTDVQGNITPTWSGILIKATVRVTLSSNTATYYTDTVTMYDTTYPSTAYVIDRKLLSPASNPFGLLTNPQGIYVIDCGGKNICIGNSRIVGTLVLLSPGDNTTIQGAMVWEPAVPTYPAMLTDKKITISIGTAPLSEATLNMNLNPLLTPYPYNGGASNITMTDSYPSSITGIVYSKSDLNLANSATIAGVVLADGNIVVSASALNLCYRNTYLANPPPGFGVGTTQMRVVPGSWQRVVN